MPLKVLTVVGTRPEVIKLAPIIDLLRKRPGVKSTVCVTAQHRHLLNQMLDFFAIEPDYDLDIMRPRQDLFDITVNALAGLRDVLRDARPDLVLVQGDTTTCLAGALAASYAGVDVGHVEAGLRTGMPRDPFPEELNRSLVSRIATYHFATTQRAMQNLIDENIDPERIWVTGSTGIDSLKITLSRNRTRLAAHWQGVFGEGLCARILDPARSLMLVTLHRRENLGRGLGNVCKAVRQLALRYPDLDVVVPVHPNPAVRRTVIPVLHGHDNIHLLDPLAYDAFVWLLEHADLVLTDSGGVQEEAPYLGVPTFVTRVATERQESIACGAARLVGLNTATIVRRIGELLDTAPAARDWGAGSPYGDGDAARRIVSIIEDTQTVRRRSRIGTA